VLGQRVPNIKLSAAENHCTAVESLTSELHAIICVRCNSVLEEIVALSLLFIVYLDE
jgi:hypothetical protein